MDQISTSTDGPAKLSRRASRRGLLLASILISLLAAGAAGPAHASTAQSTPTGFEVAPDAEGFRLQLLDFTHEIDDALAMAMQNPRIAPILSQHLIESGLSSPFSDDLYLALQVTEAEKIEQLRQAVAMVPGVMSSPTALRAAILTLPSPPSSAAAGAQAMAVTCGGPRQEFSKIISRTESLNALIVSKSAIGLLSDIAEVADHIADGGTGECEIIPPFCIPVPTSWLQSPFTIALTIFEVTEIALDIAIAEMEFQITEADVCINPWVAHGFVDYHDEDIAKTLAGRGCDNRDNDNNEGVDELDEDMVPPTIAFDAGISSQCFRSNLAAEAAATAAVNARDDCAEVQPNVSFQLDAALCRNTATATVSDQNPANQPATAMATLTVDPAAPLITLPAPAACYANLDAARADFEPGAAGVLIADCTDVRSDLKIVEKECVADLELSAVDECGNKSSRMVSVRVDDTPPEVKIESLLIPSIDGLSCFASEPEALATIAEATIITDNCSARNNLAVNTATSGGACNLQVTTTASDQCVGVTTASSSDSLTVRVDAQPPVVTCSVATNLLWPAGDQFMDVGVNISVSDNCDGTATPYDVIVTSDESTTYNLRVMGDVDSGPDAIVERTSGGAVQRILLRAQRRQDSMADGRVYRIRVIATDSCGLSSQADCHVVVPKNYSVGMDVGSIVNSGQFYDATEIN